MLFTNNECKAANEEFCTARAELCLENEIFVTIC
jgi:hypothetical protein